MGASVAIYRSVTVRPGFPIELLHKLWQWCNSPRSASFDDFGAEDALEFCSQMVRRMRIEQHFAVYVDGDLAGCIGLFRNSQLLATFHGICIAPRFRRQGVAIQAIEEVILQAAGDGIRKLEATFFADNDPVRTLFEQLGFEREGLRRAVTRRNGQPLDMLCYGKVL